MVKHRYEEFTRAAWGALREATPLRLSTHDLEALRGINEELDLREVEEVYLPLSRLLNLHISATQQLDAVTDTFLNTTPASVPYIIGLGGSVAVGKSTTARVLHRLLGQWSDHPNVALITTDGFLYPNAELERRGILSRKGFPQSYDTGALVDTLRRLKSGESQVETPVYSHLHYDIVPDEKNLIVEPDVVIVEGLNVLQAGSSLTSVMVSDFFDFSIYVDAPDATIKQWYIDRFLTLREAVFSNPDSYFSKYANLNSAEATDVASELWDGINAPNLVENIAPTRDRATCILVKGDDHRVERVHLQK